MTTSFVLERKIALVVNGKQTLVKRKKGEDVGVKRSMITHDAQNPQTKSEESFVGRRSWGVSPQQDLEGERSGRQRR